MQIEVEQWNGSLTLDPREAAVRAMAPFSDHGSGVLENVQDDVRSVREFVSRLAGFMCEKGIIQADDVPKIFGHGYKAMDMVFKNE